MDEYFRGRLNDKLACCGYGIPDLELAQACVRSRATVIFEEELAGAVEVEKSKWERQIKYFEIPVPDSLADITEEVELHVTLSYLAEPNGFQGRIERGLDLCWDMQGPNEDVESFRARINGESSRTGELPPDALPEPCVNLAAHTALIVQPP